MAVTNRDSTLYAKLHVSKYLGDARDRGGRVVPIPFQHTVVSGETGGASAGVRDTVNLCVLPANCMVVDLEVTAEAVWASAGVNGTFSIGDSGNVARYLGATEAYTADPGGPIATEGQKHAGLAFAGQNYKPTADTIVLLEWRVANPSVGKVIKGCFFIVPGA